MTYRAVHDGVAVEPPDGLGAYRVAEGVDELGGVADGGHDLAEDGAGEAFLVGGVEVEGAPGGGAEYGEREEGGPFALREFQKTCVSVVGRERRWRNGSVPGEEAAVDRLGERSTPSVWRAQRRSRPLALHAWVGAAAGGARGTARSRWWLRTCAGARGPRRARPLAGRT